MNITSIRRILAPFVMIGAALILTGCASAYLDPATQDVPLSAMHQVAKPKPVRMNFEFQTRGAPNSRATAFLKDAVTEQIKASGLFLTLEGGADAAILDVKINNIPLNDDSPAAKGFVTGFTFGLVGSSVSDGYECKVSYLPPQQSVPIVKTAKHAIHTTLGNASPPAGTIKTENLEQAVRKMTHAILSNALRDLSQDSGFNDSPTTSMKN
jgi:hypothetical protein